MIIHTYDEYWNQGHSVVAFFASLPEKAEMKEWCNTVYGPQGDRWKDSIEFGEVLFSDKKDLTLFLLKWQ